MLLSETWRAGRRQDILGSDLVKQLGRSPWVQRGADFLLGGALTTACWFLADQLLFEAPWVRSRAMWLRAVRVVVPALPWIVCLLLLAARLVKGPGVRGGVFFLGTVAPVVLAVGWLSLPARVHVALYLQPFDARRWRDQTEAERLRRWPPRLRMAGDLVDSRRLHGRTEGEVLELLGPPDERGPWGEDWCDASYYLGPDHAQLDSEWLLLTFDDERVLERCWIAID